MSEPPTLIGTHMLISRCYITFNVSDGQQQHHKQWCSLGDRHLNNQQTIERERPLSQMPMFPEHQLHTKQNCIGAKKGDIELKCSM